jgi:spermidine synthase
MQRLLLFYALSGALSLGYQVVWMRHFVDRFGSSTFTFVLVVSAFIAGLSAGALASARVARVVAHALRGRGRSELAVYGAIELLVTLSVLLTYVESLVPLDVLGAFPYLSKGGIHEPTLAYHLARVPLAALSVFLPCFFMGVTYPYLCKVFSEHARFPSRLYAWNTLGACSAVLLCEWLLLRHVGTDRTLALLIAGNALLGALFVLRGQHWLARCREETPEPPQNFGARGTEGEHVPVPWGVLLTGAVVSGFLSGALEADAFRRVHFVQIYNGSAMAFVSFWAIAAIFLGSWIVHRVRGWSLGHVKVAYVIGIGLYIATSGWILTKVSGWFDRFSHSGSGVSALDPEGTLATVLAVLAATGLATFPFYLCISVLLPHLCNLAQRDGRHLGALYGLNTVAFLLGMVAFSWAAPSVDMFYAFKLCTVTFAILAGLVLVLREDAALPRWAVGVAALALVVAVPMTSRGFDHDYFEPGTALHTAPTRALKGSAGLTTFVAALPGGDGIFLGTGQMSGNSRRARQYMNLMAHFPLLAHPKPRASLLICFGAGNTAGAMAQHSALERIDVVDLSRNIMETAPEFEFFNERVYQDPRVRMIHDDGRNYLNVTDQLYDLVTSEPPPPLQQGICRLYSAEYYESVKEHLTDDGFMTQWLPIYQMPPAAGRLIARTFVQAFPHTLLLTGYAEEFVLVGSKSPIDLSNVFARFALEPAVHGNLQDIAVPTAEHLVARVVMPDSELRERYGTGEVITDQKNPLSAYWVTGSVLAFPYTPDAVYRALGEPLLEAHPKLRAALTDLPALKRLVPDYPAKSLAEIETGARAVTGTDIDWLRLAELNRQAENAFSANQPDVGWGHYKESQRMLRLQVDVFVNRGWVMASHGNFPEALSWFQRGTRQFPEYQDFHYGLAVALANTGDVNGAVEALRGVLAMNPHHFDGHVMLAGLLESRGDKSEAARLLRRALELKPMAENVRQALQRVAG